MGGRYVAGPHRRAHHQLHHEFQQSVPDRAAATGSVGAEQRDHHRDADRIVRAGFALQQRAGTPFDLLATEDGEDHGRIGGRERGAD